MDEDKSIRYLGERAKYFVRFYRLRYEFGEGELPRRSYIKVLLDGHGRHLRRLWMRADGALTTREELQYDADGNNLRIETFDGAGARKGHTIIHKHGDGRTSFHRFDSTGMPIETKEEKRNDRGFLLWEHYLSVTDYGSEHESVQRVEYFYPEAGMRVGSYYFADNEFSHRIVDKFSDRGDLLSSEKYDDAGKLVSRSEYAFDEDGRVLLRKDFDGTGRLTAEENYQSP